MPNETKDRLNALLHSLQERTDLQVLEVWQDFRAPFAPLPGHMDALVRLHMGDGSTVNLLIEELHSAYPRDVRNALHHFEQGVQSMLGRPGVPSITDEPSVRFVIAQALSPGARDLLRKAGINYYDDSGSLYFRHAHWLIDIERPAKAKSRPIGSFFTGARERVVHALLHHWAHNRHDGRISGGELSYLSTVSTYTVSTLMQELERQDLVETTGKGPAQQRRLVRPDQLLDQWASAWISRKEMRTRWYLYPGRASPVDRLLAAVAERKTLHEWVLTGAAAANVDVPHLTAVDQAMVMISPGQTEEWARSLDLERTDKGANLVLVEREGAALMFMEKLHGQSKIRLASRFVQYLDLLDGYGRHEKLAHEYRIQALKMEPRDEREI